MLWKWICEKGRKIYKWVEMKVVWIKNNIKVMLL